MIHEATSSRRRSACAMAGLCTIAVACGALVALADEPPPSPGQGTPPIQGKPGEGPE